MTVRIVHGAAQRHPRLVDVAFALVLAGVLVPVTVELGGSTGAGWVWIGALHLLVVWRRVAPVVVLWVAAAFAFGAAAVPVMGPSLLVVPMVAVHSAARHRPARQLWPVPVLAVPFVVGWLAHGGPWWDAVALIALFAAAALAGAMARTRQAHAAVVRDRAQQHALLAVATERARIAREMHDIVAHNVAVMVALSDGAVATAVSAPQRAADLMAKASATGREALAETRRLVGLLREDGHAGSVPLPGLADVDALVEQVRSAGLPVELTREGEPGTCGAGAGLAAYRIVQEALTNTLKHAGPGASAAVVLRCTDSALEIEVVDDGHPEPRPLPADGHGLVGMAERVAQYGGSVRAGPGPGAGWRVRARLELGR